VVPAAAVLRNLAELITAHGLAAPALLTGLSDDRRVLPVSATLPGGDDDALTVIGQIERWATALGGTAGYLRDESRAPGQRRHYGVTGRLPCGARVQVTAAVNTIRPGHAAPAPLVHDTPATGAGAGA
jgi:hypothetical protein